MITIEKAEFKVGIEEINFESDLKKLLILGYLNFTQKFPLNIFHISNIIILILKTFIMNWAN